MAEEERTAGAGMEAAGDAAVALCAALALRAPLPPDGLGLLEDRSKAVISRGSRMFASGSQESCQTRVRKGSRGHGVLGHAKECGQQARGHAARGYLGRGY